MLHTGDSVFSQALHSEGRLTINTVFQYSIIDDAFITLADGTRLAARIWLPDAKKEKFPTVLEYLPYRKRDGTTQRDDSTFPVFAQSGIAGVRVDVSGHGDSDGDFDDEYSPRELAHGVEVINWIAQQPWSNGNVGVMGISWGGFNGLQLASMHPPALKAVISVSSTVDRYNDDIHYKNGCLLYSNFYWANTMLLYSSRPPDPQLRADWKSVWKHRLDTQPYLLSPWLKHQRRDQYWQHGSVCEDYDNYTVPTLIIGGWADLYMNAPPALLANAKGVVKAVNGPWIHKYPHFALPHPRLDFHAEAINWWKQFLDPELYQAKPASDVRELPDYRAFIATATRPGGWREREQGEWVSNQRGPVEHRLTVLYAGANGGLSNKAEKTSVATICSPQDCGIACGEMFSLSPDSDLSADQRIDDAGSLTFCTEPLTADVTVLGRPKFNCRVAIDRELGNLCVRLLDVHPDGCAYRISWGVINLSHRYGNDAPVPMVPGQFENIELMLNECGYRIQRGHRLQVSVSTAYWPAIQPPPQLVTASIECGKATSVELPVPVNVMPVEVVEPVNQTPLPDYTMHTQGSNRRWVEKDFQSGLTRYNVITDTGEEEIPGHGMRVRYLRDESWSIAGDDPLSATAHGKHSWWSARDDWKIHVESESSMRCDATHYYFTARVRAWLGDELFDDRQWEEAVERDYT